MSSASGYRRPEIAPAVFTDAAGRAIDYGKRWGMSSPPEDSYSVDTHPERFQPLHAVAEALIAHLVGNYRVQVEEHPDHAAALLHPRDDLLRVVRLSPSAPDAAALVFAFTGYPGLVVHAGVLHDFPFPVCGCDACDESWQGQADELEQLVLAVVAGGYRERAGLEPRNAGWEGTEELYEYSIEHAAGGRSGQSRSADVAAERYAQAAQRLAVLNGSAWAAWPRR